MTPRQLAHYFNPEVLRAALTIAERKWHRVNEERGTRNDESRND